MSVGPDAGLTFKLDVGLYRLDSRSLAERYTAIRIDAKSTLRERAVAFVDSVKASFSVPALATARV